MVLEPDAIDVSSVLKVYVFYSLDLNFKLKNYPRSTEVLCELLANVEDGCMERSLKNGKMLMLCLKASLLLSKVQNMQGQQNSSQVPMQNLKLIFSLRFLMHIWSI